MPDDQSGTAVSGDGRGLRRITWCGRGPAGRGGRGRRADDGRLTAGTTATACADVVARLTADDLAPKERRRLLGQLAGALRQRGFRDMFRPKAAMGWLSDAGRRRGAAHPDALTPPRCAPTSPALTDAQIADRLVRNAARTTAGIGAVGGGVAAVEWAAPPALLTAPVLLAAETVAVVAVEIKLIGELQEMYGLPVTGSGTHRAVALVQAWASRRGREPARARTWRRRGAGHGRPLRAAGPAAAAVRPQHHHVRAAAHRRRGRRLAQPAGDAAAGRGGAGRPGPSGPYGHRGTPQPDSRRPATGSASVRPARVCRRLGGSGGQRRDQAVGVSGADQPVRRGVGRVVEVDADRAAHPRPDDHEGERVGVDAEQLPALRSASTMWAPEMNSRGRFASSTRSRSASTRTRMRLSQAVNATASTPPPTIAAATHARRAEGELGPQPGADEQAGRPRPPGRDEQFTVQERVCHVWQGSYPTTALGAWDHACGDACGMPG